MNKAFQIHDCVTFLDEAGCRRVGNVTSISLNRHEASVAVPGWRDGFAVDLSDLAAHAECGSR